MKRFIFYLLISLVCSFPIIAFAADLTIEQKKELTVFGMKAMGVNANSCDIKNIPSLSELELIVATGLNLNGHLCAKLRLSFH